jgi:hypothetical protein
LLGFTPRPIFLLPVWLAIHLNVYNPIQEQVHQSLKVAQSALFPQPAPLYIPTRLCFQSILWKKKAIERNVILKDLGLFEVDVGFHLCAALL